MRLVNKNFIIFSNQQFATSYDNDYYHSNNIQYPQNIENSYDPVTTLDNPRVLNGPIQIPNIYSSSGGNDMVWSSQWTEWLPMKMFNAKRHRDAQTKQHRKTISPISIKGNLTKEARDTYEEMAKQYSSVFEDLGYG